MVSRLLKAARTFYLNTGELFISDEEYDKLFKESGLTKSELYDKIELEQNRNHSFENVELSMPKIQYVENRYLPPLQDGEFDTMKFDGSSIKLIYKDGKLANILSSSGISQLRKLENKVPRSVDPSISLVYCEALVRVSEFGDGARGKANGLINSKKMQWEVDQYLHLMAVHAVGSDIDRLRHLESDFFHVCEKIYDIQSRVTSNRYEDWCVDGVVRYSPIANKIFKLYYVESKEVTVEDIEISYTDTKTMSASLRVTPVQIDGYNVDHVSPNGMNNLFSKGLGIGSRIKIARAGQTIPKVIEVISPNYDIHIKCECGEDLIKDHIVGNNLRCPNKNCITRLTEMRSEFDQWLNPVSIDIIMENPKYNYFNMLGLERYNIKKLNYSESDMTKLKELLISRDYDQIYEHTCHCMDLKSEQMKSNLDYKLTAYLTVLYERI